MAANLTKANIEVLIHNGTVNMHQKVGAHCRLFLRIIRSIVFQEEEDQIIRVGGVDQKLDLVISRSNIKNGDKLFLLETTIRAYLADSAGAHYTQIIYLLGEVRQTFAMIFLTEEHFALNAIGKLPTMAVGH